MRKENERDVGCKATKVERRSSSSTIELGVIITFSVVILTPFVREECLLLGKGGVKVFCDPICMKLRRRKVNPR